MKWRRKRGDLSISGACSNFLYFWFSTIPGDLNKIEKESKQLHDMLQLCPEKSNEDNPKKKRSIPIAEWNR